MHAHIHIENAKKSSIVYYKGFMKIVLIVFLNRREKKVKI